MSPRRRQGSLAWGSALAVALACCTAQAETFVWVDENGVTHMTDDPEAVPESLRGTAGEDVDRLRSLWGDRFEGPVPPTPPGGSSRDADRVVRWVRSAVEDLSRGEVARAAATLRSAQRLAPRSPEVHWYLALLNRRRGRYERAERHLEAFLAHAGEGHAPWRALAEKRLAALADERRLADATALEGPLELVDHNSSHFRVQLDADLGRVRKDYAPAVLGDLEQAREFVSSRVGVAPEEPLGVVFYGKAAYVRAHSHR
ncbi:MAG: DUF4124 domain-containing protein, partial [Proteobacteria bacterium]|nr:DUF4124 domain-containing protein [Pseudomonadota bacterium]